MHQRKVPSVNAEDPGAEAANTDLKHQQQQAAEAHAEAAVDQLQQPVTSAIADAALRLLEVICSQNRLR